MAFYMYAKHRDTVSHIYMCFSDISVCFAVIPFLSLITVLGKRALLAFTLNATLLISLNTSKLHVAERMRCFGFMFWFIMIT